MSTSEIRPQSVVTVRHSRSVVQYRNPSPPLHPQSPPHSFPSKPPERSQASSSRSSGRPTSIERNEDELLSISPEVADTLDPHFVPERCYMTTSSGQTHVKCNLCLVFLPNQQEETNIHISVHHQEVAFKVIFPTETWYFTIDEVIKHFFDLRTKEQELGEKIVTLGLVQYPAQLMGLSCSKCRRGKGQLDASTEQAFMAHMKVVCGEEDLGAMWQYLIAWCRGCSTRFKTKDDLILHIKQFKSQNKKCFPGPLKVRQLVQQAQQLLLSSTQLLPQPWLITNKVKREGQERVNTVEVDPPADRQKLSRNPEVCEQQWLAVAPPPAPTPFNVFRDLQEEEQASPNISIDTSMLQDILNRVHNTAQPYHAPAPVPASQALAFSLPPPGMSHLPSGNQCVITSLRQPHTASIVEDQPYARHHFGQLSPASALVPAEQLVDLRSNATPGMLPAPTVPPCLSPPSPSSSEHSYSVLSLQEPVPAFSPALSTLSELSEERGGHVDLDSRIAATLAEQEQSVRPLEPVMITELNTRSTQHTQAAQRTDKERCSGPSKRRRREKDTDGLVAPVFAPPVPTAPLMDPGQLFAQDLPVSEVPESADCEKDEKDVVGLLDSDACRKGQCSWANFHDDACSKMRIMFRCGRNKCKEESLHQNQYFYLNPYTVKSQTGGVQRSCCPALRARCTDDPLRTRTIPLSSKQALDDPRTGCYPPQPQALPVRQRTKRIGNYRLLHWTHFATNHAGVLAEIDIG